MKVINNYPDKFYGIMTLIKNSSFWKGSYVSFPSGHTITIWGTIWILSFIIKSKAIKIPLFILGILVGMSRIYLVRHWSSDVSESIIGITLEDIREQFQLWMEGKITRTEVEYWSDRRNTCFHHYDDVEFYPIEKEDLQYLFREFHDYDCKFKPCNHMEEIQCGVKEAVESKQILESRYEDYKVLFTEKQNQKRKYIKER